MKNLKTLLLLPLLGLTLLVAVTFAGRPEAEEVQPTAANDWRKGDGGEEDEEDYRIRLVGSVHRSGPIAQL